MRPALILAAGLTGLLSACAPSGPAATDTQVRPIQDDARRISGGKAGFGGTAPRGAPAGYRDGLPNGCYPGAPKLYRGTLYCLD